MNKQKWLGIDYGKSRIGLALSDDLLLMAHAVQTVASKPREVALKTIADFCLQRKVTGLVVGLPKKTTDSASAMQEEVGLFVEELLSLTKKEGLNLQLEWYDERFTTVLAQQFLQSSGVKAKKQRSVVDQVAASIILQNFLDRKKLQNT